MYFFKAEPFHEIQISLDIVKKKSTILLDEPNKNDKLDILLALCVHPILFIGWAVHMIYFLWSYEEKERIVF